VYILPAQEALFISERADGIMGRNNKDFYNGHAAYGGNKPSILASKSTGYTPKGNYESVNSQGSSSSLASAPEEDPHKYRLTSYGDD
jgi:hypothetical protein